jgi:hypothetical protein
MWDRCGIDVDRCRIGVASMWHLCGIDLASMWHRCGIDVASMWFDEASIWIDVASMWIDGGPELKKKGRGKLNGTKV